MGRWIKNFRFKAWHFCLILLMVLLIAHVKEGIAAEDTEDYVEGELPELTSGSILDNIGNEVSFVLIYTSASDQCKKMEHLMSQMARERGEKARFFKMDLDKNTNLHYDYNVSGVPCIIVFKGNQEINRIMGVISLRNFNIICDRLTG